MQPGPARGGACVPSWLRDFVRRTLPDPDVVLSYDTVKLVRVLDRRLGFIYYGVQLLVVAYIVFVVFMINKKYLDMEKSTGWIITKVMKPQFDRISGIPFDVFDRITNPGEQGAVFIPTHILVTRGQTQEGAYCESPVHNCTTAEDCNIGNEMLQRKECSPNGHCMRRQWCPAENPDVPSVTESHYLEYEHVQLWFQTYLHYHRFMLDVSTADEKESVPFPKSRANTYRLVDLVRLANIDPLECVELGAVMLLNALFDCNLDKASCEMKVETMNVDTETGYNHVYSHYYLEDGIRKRDAYRAYGIRIAAFTIGFGQKTSFSQIVLQISSAIALLGLAESVADFWLLNVIAERSHYASQKIHKTEDFNPDP